MCRLAGDQEGSDIWQLPEGEMEVMEEKAWIEVGEFYLIFDEWM